MTLSEILVADEYYWVRSKSADEPSLQIAQVSSIFGSAPEFFSIIVPGDDQHYAPEDFDFIAHVPVPAALLDPPKKTTDSQMQKWGISAVA
jgi:hypothetical protein